MGGTVHRSLHEHYIISMKIHYYLCLPLLVTTCPFACGPLSSVSRVTVVRGNQVPGAFRAPLAPLLWDHPETDM